MVPRPRRRSRPAETLPGVGCRRVKKDDPQPRFAPTRRGVNTFRPQYGRFVVTPVCEADDGSRTRDLELGKLALYQLSYVRVGEPF